MDKIQTLILLAAVGAIWQNNPIWQWILIKTKLERKPFNCTLCWTFWMSLSYSLAIYNVLDSICIASGAAILGELADRKLNNL